MARLSKHGTEIGRVQYLTYCKAYMSDGTVLKNFDGTWKVFGKVKQGFTPESAYRHAVEKATAFEDSHPAFTRYKRMLHAEVSQCHRWKVHTAISMMPDDPDGVWSETCDGYGDNAHLDVDDCAKLCDAFKAAADESDAMKAAQPA